MLLKSLTIAGYRNLEAVRLDCSPYINCLVGANGMGKSNVLDAIYYLSFCRGFVSPRDADNLNHHSDYFFIEGIYLDEHQSQHSVLCNYRRGGRKHLKTNDKETKRLSQHIGRFPLVIIAPSNAMLITGGSEERRNFMDTTITQYDATYLNALMRYDRGLKQRNALLKQETEPDPTVMEVVEDMMSDAADTICASRRAFCTGFVPYFSNVYNELSGKEDSEATSIHYVSHSDRGQLKPLLQEWRAKERIVGYTLHGPHRDDLDFCLNTFKVRHEASQGQQKTFFIALKLAQYLFLRHRGEQRVPILLLDDVFDKLDTGRVARIIEYIAHGELGQTFITDTSREHLNQILSTTSLPHRFFMVEEGVVKAIDTPA